MTVASLQEELRETKRRLEAYRSARMASRLAQTSKKTASALMEENPALAIPARLKEEARDAATALDRERSRTLELEREVARAREDARVAVEAAEAKAAEAVRAASLAAEKKIEDARLVARAAREAETDALTNGRNVRAALVDARTALELEQHRSHGLERESRVLHDTVLAARSVAEEARGKALAEAAAARVARAKSSSPCCEPWATRRMMVKRMCSARARRLRRRAISRRSEGRRRRSRRGTKKTPRRSGPPAWTRTRTRRGCGA